MNVCHNELYKLKTNNLKKKHLFKTQI